MVKFRIVLLANANSIHVVQWVIYLSALDVEIVVISQEEKSQDFPENIPVYITPYNGVGGYFLNASYIRELLKTIRPNIVHAHYASGYGTLARLVDFHPYVLSVWGSDVYDFPYRSKLHHWVVRKNLYAADRLSSTSRCMMEQTLSIAPKLNEFSIIPFGVDFYKFFRKDLKKDKDGEIVIGTVKTLSEKYGIDLLIKAFALLRDTMILKYPEIASKLRLRIVGSGNQEMELKALTQKLEITEVTNFIGSVSHNQVPLELNKLDIYVALSRSESFGVAVIEAGAMGLPVVVSNVGGLPEVVQNNKTGFVVRKENPEEAAEKLVELVLNPKLRDNMGEYAHKFIRQNFSWELCTQKMLELYKEVLISSGGYYE